jgi:nucleotide-binding universal stress UspA family protein
MFDNVIVGIDAEEGGRDALTLAKNLLGDGGRMTLANVYPSEAYVWRGGNPAYHIIEKDESVALLQRARQEAGVEAELTQVGDSSVGRGLHVMAEAAEADLLVVGSSRRGLMDRVMLGNDTRAALNGAPCAVAMAPAGYAREPHPMREIGVGYNGSRESEHALSVARELAKARGAKLSAFEAVSVPTYLVHGTTAPDGTPINALVDGARERIAGFEGVEPHAAYGEPAEELALYSASLDLLVVGSRDYGPLGRLVHGSTTHRLARSARCPLLVLTRAVRESESAVPGDDPRQAAGTAGH